MADSSAKKRKRPSAKEARARMTRAVGSQAPISRIETEAPAVEEEHGPTPGEGSAQNKAAEKLVRLSVDVPTSKHRFLRVMAAQEGVSGMAVVRALIDELQDDEELAERVRERLAEPDR